jgi:hypothetical protein
MMGLQRLPPCGCGTLHAYGAVWVQHAACIWWRHTACMWFRAAAARCMPLRGTGVAQDSPLSHVGMPVELRMALSRCLKKRLLLPRDAFFARKRCTCGQVCC